jgi:hypothetical protein
LLAILPGNDGEIVASVITAAKTGDMTAARLVLDRIAPIRKGRPITLALPTMSAAADVTTAISAIISQMAEGEITPDEPAVAASVIETKRKALETEELDRGETPELIHRQRLSPTVLLRLTLTG